MTPVYYKSTTTTDKRVHMHRYVLYVLYSSCENVIEIIISREGERILGTGDIEYPI